MQLKRNRENPEDDIHKTFIYQYTFVAVVYKCIVQCQSDWKHINIDQNPHPAHRTALESFYKYFST